jgi:hypothetical protein
MHTFVLVIIMRFYSGSAPTATTSVGPFKTPQACLAAKEVAEKQTGVNNAFCLQLD